MKELKFDANLGFQQEAAEVKIFAKLPNRFKIPTPPGTYNPDRTIPSDKETGK